MSTARAPEPELPAAIREAIDPSTQPDWEQFRQNGGPPCFHVEGDGRFCFRAQRWEGHGPGEWPMHAFVTLAEYSERIARLALSYGQQEAQRLGELMAPAKFNLNYNVKFRLTERGRRHLSETGDDWKLTPGYSTAVDADGWAQWQLWDVAATFGAIMGNGLPVPIETEIELIPDPYRVRCAMPLPAAPPKDEA